MPLFILFLCLSMSIPSVTLSVEEAPDFVTKIVLKDGNVINGDMGWIEGDTIVYRKYGSTMTVSLERVDLDKTYKYSNDHNADQAKATFINVKYRDFTISDLTYIFVPQHKVGSGFRSASCDLEFTVTNNNPYDGFLWVDFVGLNPNRDISIKHRTYLTVKAHKSRRMKENYSAIRPEDISEWRVEVLGARLSNE